MANRNIYSVAQVNSYIKNMFAQDFMLRQVSMSIVWQNIIFALGIKLLILVLAALGIANMWLAVFGDVGVAIIAILNAMRAMGVKNL